MKSWLADLKALESKGDQSGVPPWSGSPMDVAFSSALPPAPLADFSIGQSDLLPSTGALSLWDPDIRLFSRYEFEDPVSLALGAFDLSKAIILVLPLLMIVLSFDALSSERDAGRLGLILAQGASLRRLVWQRLLIRCGAVVGLVLLLAAFALIFNRGATSIIARLPWFALWSACAVLYSAFWFALIACIASRNRSGGSSITSLLLCWTGLTLIAPAAVTSIAEAAYPSPSRLQYLADARRVEIDTERAEAGIARQFFTDHPDLVVDSQSEMPAYIRTAFFVTSTIDDATRPILKAFDDAAAHRDQTVAFLSYLSPAVVAHRAFSEFAGSSAARHRRYVARAMDFKAAYAKRVASYVVAGERLPSSEAEALPLFVHESIALRAAAIRVAPALVFMGLAAGALFLTADRRLQRLRVFD